MRACGGSMSLDAYLKPRAEGAPALLVCGTMNFGKRTPEDESVRIIERALERGVRFFDTANAYNGGESERIVGRALRAHRGQAGIATKCGFGPNLAKPEGLAASTVLRACDESLSRLGIDAIDLYYLHRPDPTTPIEETVSALEKLRAQGKIKAWAVSNFASWQIGDVDRLCDDRRFERPKVSQVIYNLLIRQLDVEYARFTRAHPIHTTIYNPLAGGLLAGKGLPGKEVEQGSRFAVNKMYQSRYLSQRFFELVEAYGLLADQAQMSLVDLAYAWVAQRPFVDSILLGPATVQQLDVAVDACARRLPEGLAAKIDEVHTAFTGTDTNYAR
jgi:aryl-alcohol dehydrogenase-like predicted oxidoreductase